MYEVVAIVSNLRNPVKQGYRRSPSISCINVAAVPVHVSANFGPPSAEVSIGIDHRIGLQKGC